jgi:hypothetical protein
MSSPLAPWAHPYWFLTGAVIGFSVAGMLSIGIFLLPVALAAVVTGVLRDSLRNRAAISVIGGLATAPLYLAWLNRNGPGWICESTQHSTKCSEQLSPWPFLAVALALIIASGLVTALLAWTSRRDSEAQRS